MLLACADKQQHQIVEHLLLEQVMMVGILQVRQKDAEELQTHCSAFERGRDEQLPLHCSVP